MITTLLFRIGERAGEDYPLDLYLNENALTRLRGEAGAAADCHASIPAAAFEEAVAAGGAPGAGGLRIAPSPIMPDEPCHCRDAAAVCARIREQERASAEFKEIGSWLYALLNRGEVGRRWRELRLQWQGSSLRTFYEIQPEPLRRLPWELTYEGDSPVFLGTSMCRCQPAPHLPAPAADAWPLRILVVVGDANDEKVAAEEEVAGIESALRSMGRRVFWVILREPNREFLLGEMADLKPHVLHFIGHGKLTRDGQEACLQCKEQGGDAWEWTAGQIRNDLEAGWAPRFAFLHACHSDDPAAHGSAQSVAEAFLRRVPAVLGIRAKIDGLAAASFAEEFYRELVRGGEIDLALLKARRAIGNGRESHRDWFLPTLTTRCPVSLVLRPLPVLTNNRRSAIAAAIGSTPAAAGFHPVVVGRQAEQRDFWRWLDPFDPGQEARPLLVVQGQDKAGKKELVRSCVECCAMRGRVVVQVMLDKNSAQTALDILHAISAAVHRAPAIPSQRRLDRGRFAPFDALLAGIAPPGLSAANRNRVWPDGNERVTEEIADTFQAALAAQGALDSPLILILYGLNLALGAEEDHLHACLLEPLIGGTIEQVRLVIVPGRKNLQDSGFKKFLHIFDCVVPVPLFPKPEFVPLTSEYLRFHGLPVDDSALQVMTGMEMKLEGLWTPNRMEDARKVLQPERS